MIKEQYLYSELTEKIIGCSMKVHNTLGNGFQEVIYQRSLALELKRKGVDFQREVEMPIFYEGVAVGERRADSLVENKIMLEIKALTQLENVHLAQALNYLETYKIQIGLLINFGSTKLQFKSLTNERKLS
jgi:GxxExxY protein